MLQQQQQQQLLMACSGRPLVLHGSNMQQELLLPCLRHFAGQNNKKFMVSLLRL